MKGFMTSHIAIRLAVPAERHALEELQRRASLVWEEYREALLANPDAIELPVQQIEEGRVCVAEDAQALLGFSAVLPRDDGDAELDGLFVEPAVWRRGVGRALVERAAQTASASGARALHVVANPRAEDFYRACGFVRTGESATRFGTALTMRLALS
jgi:GNAT superfamily N-acetyltransferase